MDYHIFEVNQRLKLLLAQEELIWKQRSKLFWLQVGDSNTKLFHHYASSRKQNNTIVNLRNELGHVYINGDGLHENILHYFQNTCTSNG